MKVMFLDTSLAPVGFNIPQQQVLQSRNPWKFMWSICLHQCSLLCPVAGTQPDKQKARFCASQLCFLLKKKTSWRLASLHPEPLVSKIWKWQNGGSVLQRREAAQGTLKSSGQWSTSMPKSTWQKMASKTPSFQKKRITRGKKKHMVQWWQTTAEYFTKTNEIVESTTSHLPIKSPRELDEKSTPLVRSGSSVQDLSLSTKWFWEWFFSGKKMSKTHVGSHPKMIFCGSVGRFFQLNQKNWGWKFGSISGMMKLRSRAHPARQDLNAAWQHVNPILQQLLSEILLMLMARKKYQETLW